MNWFALAQITSSDTTVIAVGTAICGGLTSAVIFLFKLFVDDRKECKEDKKALWVEVSALHAKVATLLEGKKHE